MIDLLDDIKDFVNQQHDRWWTKYRETRLEDVVIPLQQAGATKTLDASGNGTLHLYRNTTGRILLVGRITLGATTPGGTVYTPATTFTSASCYAYLFTGEQFGGPASAFDFLPNAPGGQVFPQIAEYSSRNAIRIEQNETLSLYVVAGPANAEIYSTIYGELLPTKYARLV